MIGQPIATWEYLGRDPSGDVREITVQIGQPSFDGELGKCPVAIEGLEERVYPMSGVNTLQALILAIRFAQKILEAYYARGGRLYDPAEYREKGDEAMAYPENPFL